MQLRSPQRTGFLPFRIALALGAISLFGPTPEARADATDVSLLFVTKTQLFLQNSPNNPLPRTNPFRFDAGATPTGANRITSAQFTPPGGTAKTMTNSGGGTFVFDGGTFATQAALDAAFQNGTYNFSLQTTTGVQTYNDSIALTGNTYPANTPKILNGNWALGGLQIDSTQTYSFSWNDISPFTAPNQMVFQIVNAAGAVVFTRTVAPDPSGFNINLSMPANTLQPGAYFTATLTFQRRVVTVVSPTFSKVATYATATSFKIATISGVPVITSPTSIKATVGQPFFYQITATNHPFNYNTSTLPAGLTLDDTLGIISGTPTGSPGTVQVSLSAGNIDGVGSGGVTSAVQGGPGPVITSSTTAFAYTGQPFNFQVVTKGASSAARITAAGLPAGLSIDPVSGRISGTTAATGSFLATLTLTDGNVQVTGSLQLNFTTDGGYPVITNANIVIVPRGQPFTYTIATPGATDPIDPPNYTFLGTLPPGFVFTPATGTISGTYSGPLGQSTATDSGGGDPPHIRPLSGGALLGSIQLFGTNSHGTSTFQLLFLAVPSGAVNISTRLFVGTSDNVLIGGFIVTGNASKVVIIRAIGPSTGVPGALQDPVLELHDSKGGVVINDNWRATQEQIIKDTTIPPLDDRESAIVIGLDPGNYTAIVSGKNGATGIALVEVYDLGTASLDSTSKAQLAQISSRGNVLAGDNVMIGGFFVSGVTTKILLRAIGPSLTGFGVANALQDTTLELHDGSGTTIGSNDDWRSTQEQAIKDTTIPPTDNRESAIVQNLVPGAYTAIVRGKNNTTGVALVEVYALP
jgi:hypothetical protein